MLKNIFILFLSFLSSLSLPCIATEYGHEYDYEYDANRLTPALAFEHGRLLRAQFRHRESVSYLKSAALRGNGPAAYLYAVELNRSHHGVPARKYWVIAAKAGQLAAIKYLADCEWLSQIDKNRWHDVYYQALLQLGKHNPALSLYALSEFYDKTIPHLSQQYLNLAADLKYAPALLKKAEQIEDQGKTHYFTSEDDIYTLQEVYKQAAQTGYMPAVRRYILFLHQHGQYINALKWRHFAMMQGDLLSLARLGFYYAKDKPERTPQELVKGAAYLKLYLDIAGQEQMAKLYKRIEYRYQELIVQLTPTQNELTDDMVHQLRSQVVFHHQDKFWQASVDGQEDHKSRVFLSSQLLNNPYVVL